MKINKGLIVSLIIILFILLLTFRTIQVYEYRINLMMKISHLNGQDIMVAETTNEIMACSSKAHWRWQELDKISYDTMLFNFWKPLDSFYPDKSFLK